MDLRSLSRKMNECVAKYVDKQLRIAVMPRPGSRAFVRERLVVMLEEARRPHSLSRGRVEYSREGQPRWHAPLGEGRALSFSHGARMSWAALGTADMALGIDLSEQDEFGAGYPLARAFGEAEWNVAQGMESVSRGLAAPLLWSVKEAVVKALGTGFRLWDPLDIVVTRLESDGLAMRSEVSLCSRSGSMVAGALPVVSFLLGEAVLSIASWPFSESDAPDGEEGRNAQDQIVKGVDICMCL